MAPVSDLLEVNTLPGKGLLNLTMQPYQLRLIGLMRWGVSQPSYLAFGQTVGRHLTWAPSYESCTFKVCPHAGGAKGAAGESEKPGSSKVLQRSTACLAGA